jgi:hypothetical protein
MRYRMICLCQQAFMTSEQSAAFALRAAGCRVRERR